MNETSEHDARTALRGPSSTCASPPRSRPSATATPRATRSPPSARPASARPQSLGAVVVEEFVDRGESARKRAAGRSCSGCSPTSGSNPVEYVIVHKVDRLARNRADDVEIKLALQAAGATLVSCTENIDETPSGMLLHGIMSSIAEFYSRNLANEVMKGLIQKAKNGGTPMKAPLGYRNVRLFENGREIRTVEVDPVRGAADQLGLRDLRHRRLDTAGTAQRADQARPRCARRPERSPPSRSRSPTSTTCS